MHGAELHYQHIQVLMAHAYVRFWNVNKGRILWLLHSDSETASGSDFTFHTSTYLKQAHFTSPE